MFYGCRELRDENSIISSLEACKVPRKYITYNIFENGYEYLPTSYEKSTLIFVILCTS